MINADMRLYDYFTYGEDNAYGQPTLIKDAEGNPIAQGQIKMAIYETGTSVQQNINYTGATYMGLTHNADVNDKYVIAYGDDKLKVLYVNPHGRYKRVFMGAM